MDISYLPKQFRNIMSKVNDEYYWDRYVRKWELSKKNRELEQLGDE